MAKQTQMIAPSNICVAAWFAYDVYVAADTKVTAAYDVWDAAWEALMVANQAAIDNAADKVASARLAYQAAQQARDILLLVLFTTYRISPDDTLTRKRKKVRFR